MQLWLDFDERIQHQGEFWSITSLKAKTYQWNFGPVDVRKVAGRFLQRPAEWEVLVASVVGWKSSLRSYFHRKEFIKRIGSVPSCQRDVETENPGG